MSIDRVLGIVGILIGVPGFLALFFSGQWIQGILVFLIVLALCAHAYYRYKDAKNPLVTIKHLVKHHAITDPDGRLARFTRTARHKTNHRGMQEWWCRNLGADGKIQNIRIDGREPDLVEQGTGTIQVCKRFGRELEKGEEFTVVLSYELLDSFMKNRESVIHYTAQTTDLVEIKVDLPRPCTSAEAYLSFGGQQSERIDGLQVGNGRQQLELKIKKPRLGAQYHIQWIW